MDAKKIVLVSILALVFATPASAHNVTLWNVIYYPGHPHIDIIHGHSGDSNLFGKASSDQLFGHAGNDYLNGGRGNDWIDGGSGWDYCKGGLGRDHFINCEVINPN